MFKTYFPKKDDFVHEWFVVDAEGQVLGRLASQIASVIRGKHKPVFSPHMDTGDFIIVVNAEKVRLSGKKSEIKTYFSHSGYIGSARIRKFKTVIQTHPERVIQHAVKGMLPHNKLGRKLFKKLKVYQGPDHPHIAQNPKPLVLKG